MRAFKFPLLILIIFLLQISIVTITDRAEAGSWDCPMSPLYVFDGGSTITAVYKWARNTDAPIIVVYLAPSSPSELEICHKFSEALGDPKLRFRYIYYVMYGLAEDGFKPEETTVYFDFHGFHIFSLDEALEESARLARELN